MQSVSSLEHARALQCMLHNANKDCLSGLSQLDVENACSCYVRIAAYKLIKRFGASVQRPPHHPPPIPDSQIQSVGIARSKVIFGNLGFLFIQF